MKTCSKCETILTRANKTGLCIIHHNLNRAAKFKRCMDCTKNITVRHKTDRCRSCEDERRRVNDGRILEAFNNGAVRKTIPSLLGVSEHAVTRVYNKHISPPPVTPERCISDLVTSVAKVSGISRRDILGDGRFQSIARARLCCYYIAGKMGHGISATGRAMGRDHTSVLYGIRRAEAMLPRDGEMRRIVETVMKPPYKEEPIKEFAIRRVKLKNDYNDSPADLKSYLYMRRCNERFLSALLAA